MSPPAGTTLRPPLGSARFAARARSRRRARWRAIGLALLLAALVGAAVWAVAFSSLLAVRSVQVAGADRLSPDEVSRAAHVPTGGSLAVLDADAVAARVAKLAPVASVRVQRRLPHTVRIVITERTPTAVLRTPDGMQLVDASGVAFGSVDEPPKGLPLIRSTSVDRETLARVSEMLAALPAKVRSDVVQVRADSSDDMAVWLRNGDRVVWGGPAQAEFKADVLTVLMQQKGRIYDVSVPEAPVIRN